MSEAQRDTQELRFSFIELLAYLAASAHGAISVSKLYGPLRLMEAAEHLIRLMDSLGLADEELRDLAERIIAMSMVISTDSDRCLAFTDETTMLLARKLKEATPQA